MLHDTKKQKTDIRYVLRVNNYVSDIILFLKTIENCFQELFLKKLFPKVFLNNPLVFSFETKLKPVHLHTNALVLMP